MKPLDLDTLLQRVTLRPGSTRWVFTQYHTVPVTLRGKPVPRTVPPGSQPVYFVNGTTYALCEYCTPLLQAYAALAPEAQDGILSLDPMKVHEAQSAVDTMHKATPNNVWTEIRDVGIRETIRQIMERSGLEEFQVVPAVADLFDVSGLVVRRAMGATEATPGRTKATEYKRDPRWRLLAGEVQRAKSGAYGRDMVRGAGTPVRYGRFDTVDLLIKHRGERLFPESCPVLGLPLIYDRHAYPKDYRLIAVARKDNTKPMAPDNVHLVSRKAYKLLETRSKPGTPEEADAIARWRGNTNHQSVDAQAETKDLT